MSTAQTQTRTRYAEPRTSRGTASGSWAPRAHSHGTDQGDPSSMAGSRAAQKSVPIKGFHLSMMPQDYPPMPSYPEKAVRITLPSVDQRESTAFASRFTDTSGSSHYSMRGPSTQQSSHARDRDDQRRWEKVRSSAPQASHTHLGPSTQGRSNLKSSLKPQVRIMEPSASSQVPSVEDDLRDKLASVTTNLRSTEKALTDTRTALFQKMQEEEDMTDYAVKLRKTVENQNSEIEELKHYEDLAKKSSIQSKELGDMLMLERNKSELYKNKLDFYRRGFRKSVADELRDEVAERMKMSSRAEQSEA